MASSSSVDSVAEESSLEISRKVDLLIQQQQQILENRRKRRLTVLCEKVKFLRTFQLCASKWGNNDDDVASLADLLVRIEDVASEVEEANRLSWDVESDKRLKHFVKDANRRIDFFKREINQWYIKFSDCSRHSSSSSSSQQQDMTSDEIVEFIDSLLGSWDFLFDEGYLDHDSVYLLDSLKEKIIFLRNFIRFTTLQLGSILINNSGDDDDRRPHLGNLLTHIRALAISAAHFSYMCQFPKNFNPEMQFKISQLLQKIKPVDPQVYKTYVQILKNLSRQPHTAAALEKDVNVSKDFITSLLSYLFEILMADAIPVFSSKDQLQILHLHDGLRSLRYILENKPKNFDENMWDLTRVVVCDAGIVIFSLFLDSVEDGLAKETIRTLPDLLERIKRITTTVAVESPQGSIFKFANVDELRFVDFLLENLAELTNREAASAAIPNLQIQKIYEGLANLRPFLGKILELHDQKEKLQPLWNRIMELAYTVEFLVDSLVVGDIADSSVKSFDSLDSIIEEIKIIKLDASKTFDKEGFDVEATKVAEKSDYFSLERTVPIIKDEIVGFDDEATLIRNQLVRGGNQLQIIAIVGMPGSGKTTLAKMIYNDIIIKSHFHVYAWCCISQGYNKKNALLEILTYIFHKQPGKYSEKDEEDLAHELYQGLKRNKYLIVLDDVWNIDSWNGLEASFPDDANGSRIILTSRNTDIAPKDEPHWKTHELRRLTNDESSNLLKKKLFPEANWPATLCELRTQILEKCKGLPIAIVILAGILATMERGVWKEIVEHLNSGKVSIVEKCIDMLELSYKYLPDKLKSCLLYFGVFPEDQELTTKKLTWLWIAEGFVCKTQSKSLEDEAKDYLMHLIKRSLVMVGKQSSTGGVKTCRVHDLLHEFCVKKAREERFFQVLKGYNELSDFSGAHNVRRLCIHSKANHLNKSRIFCPRLRSLILFGDNKWSKKCYLNPVLYIGNSKDVRVLDLSQFGDVQKYPVEMALLVHLRYLALATWPFSFNLSSIANLVNLETLIAKKGLFPSLSNSIWNLKKLRHLEIGDFLSHLEVHDIDNPAQLCNLDTLSSINFDLEYAEKILKKFPNIRKLKAYVRAGASDEENDKVLILDYLRQLESLNLASYPAYPALQVEFSFPLNLKKLTLSKLRLAWCKMSAIGNLPKLEVLKSHDEAFVGEIWNMEEESQFPSLKFLKLSSLDIVKWTASESVQEHFPRLVKLVLNWCGQLEEVPSCLGDISNLQMIEVYNCPSSVAISVQQIQEEQVSMGNEDLKVLIHSSGSP